MRTQDIINSINQNFAKVYKPASPFVNSGALWDFCIATISDPTAMSNIVFANDLGIPPVKSLILIYKRRVNPSVNFTDKESKYIGSLMGFVFKFCLNYQSQRERCKVNELGVQTATRFLDGPVVYFEP